jgi:hypothetical protein
MKKIMTVLAAAGILMLGITGQATATDGGSDSCTQNGGRASCYLYHIKLDGRHHCVYFTGSKGSSISVCRNNSMNVYLDPGGIYATVIVNIDGADSKDALLVNNDRDRCFELKQAVGSFNNGSGILASRLYDKLKVASEGKSCDTK